MKFLNRERELGRLSALMSQPEAALVVLYGQRRVGKTRLALEFCRHHDGLYMVADQSSSTIQRAWFAGVIGRRFPGFADVVYPTWTALFDALARSSLAAGWRGPVVFDEVPYLVQAAPEVASELQRWVDHGAREAGLVVALAGSSQRMMQGLVLNGNSPLFGRARELFEIRPLAPRFLGEALGSDDPRVIFDHFAAWGGIPRYWELAVPFGDDVVAAIDALVLDSFGPLNGEPDRLLLEELPPAVELRPVLDAIGAGAHRASEIGSRVGSPVTSLGRPLKRLVEVGLVIREVPFGEPGTGGKRSIYRIAAPFMRLWFKTVAPYKAVLATADPAGRRALLAPRWDEHRASCFEELARSCLPALPPDGRLGTTGPWLPGHRWWHGNEPEWDIVAENTDGGLLLGEAKWSRRPWTTRQLRSAAAALTRRPAPSLPKRKRIGDEEATRCLFVASVEDEAPSELDGVAIVTLTDMLGLRA